MTKIKKKNIFILIIIAFVALNIIWFSITSVKYNKFIKDLPRFGSIYSYGTLKDGYNYHVKKPSYLSYTGNLAVSNNETGELLIIWPLIFGGYEYGIRLEEDGIGYEFYVDENMNPINKEDPYAVQCIEKNKSSIDVLLSKANEMWKLK